MSVNHTNLSTIMRSGICVTATTKVMKKSSTRKGKMVVQGGLQAPAVATGTTVTSPYSRGDAPAPAVSADADAPATTALPTSRKLLFSCTPGVEIENIYSMQTTQYLYKLNK